MEESKMDFTASINAALNGSMDAFNFLYRTSLPSFKKAVMEYTSNTNDIDDILQEAYIKIFSQLKTLKNANSFLAWGHQICVREAINFGKKKQAKKNDVVLMPETSDEEDGMGMDEVSADTYSTEFNPEARIDSAETKRLMDEMLGELTENQRLVICMWEDQYSFKEIAQELDMPENTVKSHFNRGKKALEAKVKDLEKKGTKLYEIAPFPFFLWIFSQFRQSYTPDVSSEYAGSMLGEVVEQLPENMIDVSKSTPKSIQEYGTEEMKQSLSQTGETTASSSNVADGQVHSTDTGDAAESVIDNVVSSEDAGVASNGSVQGTAAASENGSANISAKSSGHNAAKTAAKTAGKISAARIIIPVLAIVILGTAGIIAVRSLNNDRDTDSIEAEREETSGEDLNSDPKAEAREGADTDDDGQEGFIDWDAVNDNNYGITLDMVSGTELVPRGSYLWDAPASLLCCNEEEDLWLYACVAPGTETSDRNKGEHLTVLRRGNQIFVTSDLNLVFKKIPILGDYLYDYPSIYMTYFDDDNQGSGEVLILSHDRQFGAYDSTDKYNTEFGELISESEDNGNLYYETANAIIIGGDFNDEVVEEWYMMQPFTYSSDLLDSYGISIGMTHEEIEAERQEKLFTFPIGDNLYTIQYDISCKPISFIRRISWSRDLGLQYGNYDIDFDGGTLTLTFPFELEEDYYPVYIGRGTCNINLYRVYDHNSSFFRLEANLGEATFEQIGP